MVATGTQNGVRAESASVQVKNGVEIERGSGRGEKTRTEVLEGSDEKWKSARCLHVQLKR